MSLFDKVNEDIKAAMMAREQGKLEAIRSVKAAFLTERSNKGANAVLTEEEELKIVQKLVKQRKDSADIYKTQNREDLYKKEVFEAEIISQYLPKMMSEEEIIPVINEAIAAVGAKGPQDMGKVMGTVNKKLAGKAEGRIVAELVKKLLNG
jgi:uncharacterized protein